MFTNANPAGTTKHYYYYYYLYHHRGKFRALSTIFLPQIFRSNAKIFPFCSPLHFSAISVHHVSIHLSFGFTVGQLCIFPSTILLVFLTYPCCRCVQSFPLSPELKMCCHLRPDATTDCINIGKYYLLI